MLPRAAINQSLGLNGSEFCRSKGRCAQASHQRLSYSLAGSLRGGILTALTKMVLQFTMMVNNVIAHSGNDIIRPSTRAILEPFRENQHSKGFISYDESAGLPKR